MTLPQRLRRAIPEPLKTLARAWLTAARTDSLAVARSKARRFLASRNGRPACLHLGCGPHTMEEWLNVDLLVADGAGIAFDLRKGLPFLENDSIDYIYHEHFFEHLDRRSGRRLLEESRRVLKPGGRMRIAMPDLDRSIRSYLAGYRDETGEYADQRRVLYGDQLLDTPGEALDMALRGWEHRFVYAAADIIQMVELNGFRNARRVGYRESESAPLRALETRSSEQSALIIEAEK